MRTSKLWVSDEQMERVIDAIAVNAFTILEFRAAFAELYPDGWEQLTRAFGERGDGSRRGYTAVTYLGNRLSQMSRKPGGPLLPMMRWQGRGVETPNQRRATPEERARGAEGVLRVFRKREHV